MARAKTTDKQQMTEEQGKLVTDKEYMNYVESIAQGFVRRLKYGAEMKEQWKRELTAVGIAAACEIAMRYDESKGVSFVTFSTMYVKGMIAYYVMRYINGLYLDKQERFFANLVSTEDLTRNDDEESMSGEEMLSAESINEEEKREEILDMVEKVTMELTEDERDILFIRYGISDSDLMKTEAEKRGLHISTLYRKAEAIVTKIVLNAK